MPPSPWACLAQVAIAPPTGQAGHSGDSQGRPSQALSTAGQVAWSWCQAGVRPAVLCLGPSQPGLPGGSRTKPARLVPTAWPALPVPWEPLILDSVRAAHRPIPARPLRRRQFSAVAGKPASSAQLSSGKEQTQPLTARGKGRFWWSLETRCGRDCPCLRNCWSCVGLQEPDKRTGQQSVWATHTHTHSGSVQAPLGIK